MSDVAAARKLFAEWPTPIVAVGSEVGDALPYPGASIEKDFAWSPAHPVVDAYRAFKPMPYDAPASALAAVLYAVHPEDGYFTLSDPGTITVQDDGRTRFTPAADGKHRYLIVDPGAESANHEFVYRYGVRAAGSTARPRAGSAGNETARVCRRRSIGRSALRGEHQIVRAIGSCRRRRRAPQRPRPRIRHLAASAPAAATNGRVAPARGRPRPLRSPR